MPTFLSAQPQSTTPSAPGSPGPASGDVYAALRLAGSNPQGAVKAGGGKSLWEAIKGMFGSTQPLTQGPGQTGNPSSSGPSL